MRRGYQPPVKADETPEFIELWEKIWSSIKSQYDGRALARDAYFRHVWWKGADEQDILDAARFYARTAGSQTHRLLFSNWIERGAYEDLAVQEREHQERIIAAQQRRSENVVPILEAASAEIPEERRREAVARARALMRGQV